MQGRQHAGIGNMGMWGTWGDMEGCGGMWRGHGGMWGDVEGTWRDVGECGGDMGDVGGCGGDMEGCGGMWGDAGDVEGGDAQYLELDTDIEKQIPNAQSVPLKLLFHFLCVCVQVCIGVFTQVDQLVCQIGNIYMYIILVVPV